MGQSSVEMHDVVSSNISAIGYNEERLELHVRFHSGGHYVYDDVPERIFHELKDSTSHGRYFAEHIKGTYTHRRV